MRSAELPDPDQQALRAVAFSPHRRHLLGAAGDGGTLRLWDASTRKLQLSWLALHAAPATAMCFSPVDPKVVMTVGLDKRLHIIDLGAKEPVASHPVGAPLTSVALRDDGGCLAAGTTGGAVVLYDVRAGRLAPGRSFAAHGTTEVSLALPPSCTSLPSLLLSPDILPPPSSSQPDGRCAKWLSSAQAVRSLHWQYTSPSPVMDAFAPPGSGSANGASALSDDALLLGCRSEDVSLLPDPAPRPAMADSALRMPATAAMAAATASPSWQGSLLQRANSSSAAASSGAGTALPRPWAQAEDELGVFSPVADVVPATPVAVAATAGNGSIGPTRLALDTPASGAPPYERPTGPPQRFAHDDWSPQLVNEIAPTLSTAALASSTPSPAFIPPKGSGEPPLLPPSESGGSTGYGGVSPPHETATDDAGRSQPEGGGAAGPAAVLALQAAVEESIGSMRAALLADLQTFHLDMLRQFEKQETKLAAAFASMEARQEVLLSEVRELRQDGQLRRLC
eukprot:SM000201S05921  [mRNA]  locus=s201:145019:147309:+ [translate_table: standard]